MKKIFYSIKKVRGNSDDKISGLGFLNEEGTLLTYLSFCTEEYGL